MTQRMDLPQKPKQETRSKELEQAIIAYLRTQSIDKSLVDIIDAALGAPEPPEDPQVLLNVWNVHPLLKSRIKQLEKENKKLKTASISSIQSLDTLSPPNTSASSLETWLPSDQPRFVFEGHRGRVCCCAIHPKWSLAATGSADGEIKLWNLESGEIERTVQGHTRPVLSVCFAPASHCLVSASGDLSIKVWDPRQKMANVRTLRGHEHTVSAVTCAVDLSSGIEYIFSASRDNTVRVWDLQAGALFKTLYGHTEWVRAVAVTTEKRGGRQYLLSVSSDRKSILRPVFEWPNETDEVNEEVLILNDHKNVLECCAIAPKSTAQTFDLDTESVVFATGGRDCSIFVYSNHSSTPLIELNGHDNWVQAVQFHPNGRHLISVGDDCQMIVWDLKKRKLVRKTKIHDHFVTSLAWRGKTLLTGSMDQSAKVWQ